MTGLTLPQPKRARPLIADLARSEWTKLWTLRSSYWTLAAAAVAMTGFGGVLSAAYNRHLSPGAHAAFDPASYSLSGFFLAQLAIGVLGVLVMTGEYATGSIRSTLAAAPQRLAVLAAKSGVFAAVAFAAALASSFAAFFLGQAIFAGNGIQAHLSDPGALRSVFGAALYLAASGLLALALGALIRRTAGAIAALIGLVIFLPIAVGALPAAWQNHVNPYLPTVAGQVIIGRTKFTPAGHLLSPWAGFAVFCGYALATLIAAAIALYQRDA